MSSWAPGRCRSPRSAGSWRTGSRPLSDAPRKDHDTQPIRSSIAALRQALSNDGIRRLEIAWSMGITADTALLIVLLVVVYAAEGVVGAGILGAVRMVPAVLSGMLAGATVERFRGERVLQVIGLTRAASAALCGLVIVTGAPIAVLFVLAAVSAAAGAQVRPIQAMLMPALARSPGELVAANMAWSTAEGIGAFAGPAVAGLLIAAGQPAAATLAAAVGFLGTAAVVASLRFEHAEDATGGARRAAGGLRLLDGLRALRRRPVPGWTMLGVYGQVLTRGLLAPFAVVASLELLGMGDPGVGLLNAALGLGGLVGGVFAIGLTRADRLVRTQAAALAYWGAPIAVIGLLPFPAVGLLAMIVIGVANAVYDVAIFTVFQRGSSNEERAPVFSVFEGVAGLGAVSGSLLAPVLLAAFGTRGALAVAGSILPILALIIYSRVGRTDQVSVVAEPTLRLLRQVPAFAELPLTAVERLAAGLVPVAFSAGSVLMRQGDPGDRFIVVGSGEIEVSVGGTMVQRLGPGSGVGEIALLRRSPRSATVVALTDVTGYGVDVGTFHAATCGPAAAAAAERMATANLARVGAASPMV